MTTSARLSIALQGIAQNLNEALAEAAGHEIAWVLVCQADGVAQYASNTQGLIESLLDRWKAGRLAVPIFPRTTTPTFWANHHSPAVPGPSHQRHALALM